MYITFEKIRKILYDKFSFHYDQIQLKTELELELGMDSREMVEFLSELEKTFKINISFDDVDRLIEEKEVLTIRDIVDYIEKRQLKR
jgi:acyl carrier protein